MIRLVVCDIDDTLVPLHDERLTDANREAIRAARDAGVVVTLATGRFYPTAGALISQLGLDVPVIASSGADIRLHGETVEACRVDNDVVEHAVRYGTERGLSRYLFAGADTLCLPDDEDPVLFAKWTAGTGGPPPVRVCRDMDEMLELARGKTTKVLMWAPDEQVHAEAMRHYADTLGGRAQIVCGEALNVEITARGVSKARALGRVCSMLGISLEEVMAIGDSGNDVDLLRAAGLGVAVGNAMDEAKEAADAVVASCQDSGVAEAIWRYALDRQPAPDAAANVRQPARNGQGSPGPASGGQAT